MEFAGEPHEVFDLIGLQVTDNAPAYVEVGKDCALVARLLQLVFRKIGDAGLMGETKDVAGTVLVTGKIRMLSTDLPPRLAARAMRC